MIQEQVIYAFGNKSLCFIHFERVPRVVNFSWHTLGNLTGSPTRDPRRVPTSKQQGFLGCLPIPTGVHIRVKRASPMGVPKSVPVPCGMLWHDTFVGSPTRDPCAWRIMLLEVAKYHMDDRENKKYIISNDLTMFGTTKGCFHGQRSYCVLVYISRNRYIYLSF